MDLATVDHLLTTTRSVRKRLDFSRPVDPAVIERCIEIAMQAPDRLERAGLALRRRHRRREAQGDRRPLQARASSSTPRNPDLRPHLQRRRPALAAAAARRRLGDATSPSTCTRRRSSSSRASRAASRTPACWRRRRSTARSCRRRGRSCWRCARAASAPPGPRCTSCSSRTSAKLLGIPDTVTQTALFPVAYYTGSDFKPAKRLPAAQLRALEHVGTPPRRERPLRAARPTTRTSRS